MPYQQLLPIQTGLIWVLVTAVVADAVVEGAAAGSKVLLVNFIRRRSPPLLEGAPLAPPGLMLSYLLAGDDVDGGSDYHFEAGG